MRRPSVLIVGAGGFIGRSLAESCAAQGQLVLALTRQPTRFRATNIENIVSSYDSAAHFLPLLSRTTTVVHAASNSTPASSEARPQIEDNLKTLLLLLESLQDRPDRRLVYLSSGGTLYGDRAAPARESDALSPRSYHAAGKVAAEAFIHAWAQQYGGTAVVLRPSNVFGPGQTVRPGFGVIPTAFDCASRHRPFTVWGDGQTTRDYLFIDDLISLVEAALGVPLESGCQIFNAASGQVVTLNQLLDRIDTVTRQPLTRIYRPARRVDIRRIALDTRAAANTFGWQSQTSIEDGLKRTWGWFRSLS